MYTIYTTEQHNGPYHDIDGIDCLYELQSSAVIA